MAKKYVEKYQIVNPAGEPVGPPQVFEADTKDELIAMLKAAHQNAASKFYETKKAVKLGLLMEPDSERPVQEFVERPLTADERIRVTNELNNASTQDAAFTRLLEAKFGAPLSVVRENLQEVEQNKYMRMVAEEIRKFKLDFPDYVESDSNRDTIRDYLLQKGWPVTRKNLGIAYTDLLEEGDILVTRQPVEEIETVVDTAAAASAENQPALPSETEITVPVTEATPISVVPSVVRPAVSSTLGRGSSSTPAAPRVQVKGITTKEVDAMTATEYAKKLATDPEFVRQVEALYAKK
jgi:hypothetical protein